MDQIKFDQAKEKAEALYRTIGEVYCPYLQQKVAFSRGGLEHIKFKAWNKSRNPDDQYIRFVLLYLAPEIIRKSNLVQGILKTKNFERIHRNSRWEMILKDVTYYEFIAVIKNSRMKVVVKQREDGLFQFWSLIPFWKRNEFGNKILHSGDPETD